MQPKEAGCQPLLSALSAAAPNLRFRGYGGAEAGPKDAGATIILNNPRAVVRMLRAPRGLGIARAYIEGDLEMEGDLQCLAQAEQVLRRLSTLMAIAKHVPSVMWAVDLQDFVQSGPSDIEFKPLRSWKSGVDQNTHALAYHYDVSADFYQLLLGPTLMYSCAIFPGPGATLEAAQSAKCRKICDKLQLTGGSTLLDYGSGWGSLPMFAAAEYACNAIGITASRVQHQEAVRSLNQRGLKGVKLLRGDFRDFSLKATAASSVGVYEHMSGSLSRQFFGAVRSSLDKGGLYLNQAIIRSPSRGNRTIRKGSFVGRYVFPNGELRTLESQLADLEEAGFRVLGVEMFGEHYARTIDEWLKNLESNSDACVDIAGEKRVRVWKAYLAGSRQRFLEGEINLAQVLSEARS